MMQVQNSYFISPYSVYTTVPEYFGQHTPPHTLNYSDVWKDGLRSPPAPPDELLPMRFPTPPTTPPRGFINQAASVAVQRTQSVIMKIGQGHESPQHVSTIDSNNTNSRHEDLINSSSSSSTTPQNDYMCDWIECGRYFENLEALASHVTQIHAVASMDDGLYYCRWMSCPRTERGFNARYKMLVHVRTHTKEKPHECNLCQKSFSRAENLKIHIRSHSGEKPYRCNFEGCTKAYSNSSDRFKHSRTHSMEKPYKCKVPGCEKRYTDPSSLRKHVKTFKHSLQIMDSSVAASCLSSSTNSLQISSTASRQGLDDENTGSTSYYAYSKEAVPSRAVYNSSNPYYMSPEEIFHLKSTQLECFYNESSPTTNSNYWFNNVLPQQPHIRQHSSVESYERIISQNIQNYIPESHAMTIDTESPLDLRLKRNYD